MDKVHSKSPMTKQRKDFFFTFILLTVNKTWHGRWLVVWDVWDVTVQRKNKQTNLYSGLFSLLSHMIEESTDFDQLNNSVLVLHKFSFSYSLLYDKGLFLLKTSRAEIIWIMVYKIYFFLVFLFRWVYFR